MHIVQSFDKKFKSRDKLKSIQNKSIQNKSNQKSNQISNQKSNQNLWIFRETLPLSDSSSEGGSKGMVPASRMSFCYGNYEIITGDIKSDLYYFCMRQDVNDNWIHLHGNKIEREGFITSNKQLRIILVFCNQNCSDLLWERIVLVVWEFFLKFEVEGLEFTKRGYQIGNMKIDKKGDSPIFEQMLDQGFPEISKKIELI